MAYAYSEEACHCSTVMSLVIRQGQASQKLYQFGAQIMAQAAEVLPRSQAKSLPCAAYKGS